LILRRGTAVEVIAALVAETGAAGVLWSRSYDPATTPRDAAVKAMLRAQGLLAGSRPGFLLFEPNAVVTGAGGFYRVYTPFWNAVRGLPVEATLPAPKVLVAPKAWPASDDLATWNLGAAMRRGAGVVRSYQMVGEAAAMDRLASFIQGKAGAYKLRRDFLAEDATSGLSENLTYGEISPRQIWHAGQRALHEGAAGAEHFLKELVWREFAWALMHHTPHIAHANWRPEWEGFDWRGDNPDQRDDEKHDAERTSHIAHEFLHGRLFAPNLVFGDDRHERLRERAFGEQPSQEVRDLEGDQKGVHQGPGAEGLRIDHIPQQTGHSGEQGGQPDDGGVLEDRATHDGTRTIPEPDPGKR
jgi:deoxyribodipyrimidine photolyase